jgi:hypothetical protein
MKNTIMILGALLIIGTSFGQGKSPLVPKEPRELSPAVQIYFKVNKSEIAPTEQAKLEELFGTLKKIPEFRLVLTGHTDSTGNDQYNMELSRDRVDEVYDALSSLGIPDDFMIMRYYGRSKPRVNETNKEKASRNRRVEVTIIEKPVEAPKPVAAKVDPCDQDTTIQVNPSTSIKLNKCDYKMLSAASKNGTFGVNIKKTADIMGIITNDDIPKIYRRDQGMTWLAALDISFSVDTCLKRPIEITLDPMDFDAYNRSRIKVLVKNLKNNNADKTKDRVKDVRKRTIKKDAVKFTVKTNCPTSKDSEGLILLGSPESKTKTTVVKDQTRSIEELYAVQESPMIIIPAMKTKKGFELKYKSLENPYFVFKFTDGTYSEMIPINDICKLKSKYEKEKTLDKKYKIKPKHLK